MSARGTPSLSLNKRGTPMYSREDIREQYCINDKELFALEASKKKPIFGCLTSINTQPSPCKKKHLIPACFRSRVPSDENIYSRTHSSHTSPQHKKPVIDYEDESYFKRRPKTICHTDPKQFEAPSKNELVANETGQQSDKLQTTKVADINQRPSQLVFGANDYRKQENSEKKNLSVQRTAYTQPNTPDISHASRFQTGSQEDLAEERGQQKHVSFHKTMSKSATIGKLENTNKPPSTSCSKESLESLSPKSQERLIERHHTPDFYEQQALDQLLAPVLTKALLQEKIKRACMKTAATQTDTGLVRKSLPHLAMSPANDKAEMISQGAQTNGTDVKKRLVKSFSEVARYEGPEYEIHDLDEYDIALPPQFMNDPKTVARGYSPNWSDTSRYSEYDASRRSDGLSSIDKSFNYPNRKHSDSSYQDRSSLDNTDRMSCEPGDRSSLSSYRDDDLTYSSSPHRRKRQLIKTLSEGEILQDRRRALSLASGYIEVDIVTDEKYNERLIEPKCVDECSLDLSHSRIFSSGSIIDDSEEGFHEHLIYPNLKRALSNDKNLSSSSDQQEQITRFGTYSASSDESPAINSPVKKEEIPNVSPSPILQELSKIIPPPDVPGSPIDSGLLTDGGDHYEESVSESQITVLQKCGSQSGTLQAVSDSDNSCFLLTDPSSAATTPSTRLQNIDNESFDDHTLKFLASTQSISNLSSISDEANSFEESLISESSQVNRSLIQSRQASREIDPCHLTVSSSAQSSIAGISIDDLAKELSEEGANFFAKEIRRLTSPESDSSLSHMTEQENVRSSSSHGTYTLTPKTELSDSQLNTDMSETSEDYVTATENSSGLTDFKRAPCISQSQLLPLSEGNVLSVDISKKVSVCTTDLPSGTPGDLMTFDSRDSSPNAEIIKQSLESLRPVPSVRKLSFSSLLPENETLPLDTKTRKQSGSKDLETIVDPFVCDKISISSNEESFESTQSSTGESDEKGTVRRRREKIRMLSDATPTKQVEPLTSTPKPRERRLDGTREKIKLEMKLDLSGNEEIDEKISQIKKEKPQATEKKSDKTSGKPLKRSSTPIVDKRRTPECQTPGMVRSPAMHEGFRASDWTPVRTPMTPDRVIDFNTSDESSDDFGLLSRATFKKPKASGKKTKTIDEPNMHPSHIRSKTGRDSSEILRTNLKDDMKTLASMTPGRDDMVTYRADKNFSSNFDYFNYLIPNPSINSRLENRRQSGGLPIMNWTMTGEAEPKINDNYLDPGCGLKKADSLRSFSPGSDNVFTSGSSEQLMHASRSQMCLHCGERALPRDCNTTEALQKCQESEMGLGETRYHTISHRARSEERKTFPREWGSISTMSLEMGDTPRNDEGDDERGLYSQAYRSFRWLYISPSDELLVWRRDTMALPPLPPHLRVNGFNCKEDDLPPYYASHPTERKRNYSSESTGSERDFTRKYQAITHRMVHRKASVEMYRRIMNCVFQSDKTVLVMRNSGEFGFRIHGSRPVVVSAIEEETPAETSGLEVGDIIVALNDINVLDASHSDVVRLAHTAGGDHLRLEVARTCDVLVPIVTCDPTPMCAGYLRKLVPIQNPSSPSAGSKIWTRRWFALKKDNCLYYYQNENDTTPLGAIYLLDYGVHAIADTNQPFAFTVARFGGPMLHLCAETEEARNRWGQSIAQAAYNATQRNELIEETARRMQQSPAAIASPDCFGYLHKLGSRWHQWHRRYCVLKDACLFIYQDTSVIHAIGVIHLHGYKVQCTSMGGRPNAFELVPPDPKFRHFYFFTDSENDRKRWLAGLEYSIDRWIKID